MGWLRWTHNSTALAAMMEPCVLVCDDEDEDNDDDDDDDDDDNVVRYIRMIIKFHQCCLRL